MLYFAFLFLRCKAPARPDCFPLLISAAERMLLGVNLKRVFLIRDVLQLIFKRSKVPSFHTSLKDMPSWYCPQLLLFGSMLDACFSAAKITMMFFQDIFYIVPVSLKDLPLW